jgi:CheY-like chemotaxis protein
VLLRVTDTGEGIDKETINRIFEPFFTTKPKDKGTGLGLAMVYGIIKQHEGMVHVESNPGAGATFKIYLPVTERGKTSEGRKGATVPFKVTGTILLAEDEPQVRALAIKILERAGYRVIAAVNGEEAVNHFKDNPGGIDLLVFDVVMPKMGGREAYDRIKALKVDVPVLFCSGYSGMALTAGFELTADLQLLQKPYSADALLSRIRELFGVVKK